MIVDDALGKRLRARQFARRAGREGDKENFVATSETRLKNKAAEVAEKSGAAIQQLLAELNAARLNGAGKISHDSQPQHVRWSLEWKRETITYRLRIAARLVDDGSEARFDQVLVQKEAWTAYQFEGHTPTTTMKRVSSLDIAKIREAVLMMWQE